MSTKNNYKVSGMHCASCENIITRKLQKLEGVKNVSVSYANESAEVVKDEGVTLDAINKITTPLGYTFSEEKNENEGHDVKMNHGDHMNHGNGEEKTAGGEPNPELKTLKRHVQISIPIIIFSAIVMGWDIFSNDISWLPKMSENLEEFFHHLLPILATYMMFTVGKPYLLGFWRFLRFGQANMDTLIGIGTLVAFLYSFIITAFEEPLKPYLDVETIYYDVTIIVIGFITLGKYLEANAKAKTGDALRSLISLQAKSAIVRKDGVDHEVPLDQVKEGDLVVVKPGTKIPIDGVVVEGQSYIDESMITGEPMPVKKVAKEKVSGGTMNQDGFLLVKATGVGKNSLLAHIIDLVKAAQGSRAPIQKLADKVSSIFVPVVLVIAFLALILWLVIGSRYLPFDQALALGITSFVGVLVIACPCALGLATPTAIIVSVGKGAKNGILVKNAEALEKLSKIHHIVFDKTGTITEGRPKVVYFLNKSKLKDNDIIQISASLEAKSEHPLAHAVSNFAKESDILLMPSTDFKYTKGKGISGKVKNKKYYIGSDTFIKSELKLQIDQAALNKEQTATPVVLADADEVLAYFLIGDAIKSASKEAISTLKKLKIATHLATGDREEAAVAVAKAVEIDSVHSKLLPEDKQNIVRDLKTNDQKVAVAGDGVNDAPALALADVGIAMATGTDVAIETADITLLHGDISKITQAIRLSKITLLTIKENLFWAFAFNVLGIPLAAGIFYPLGFVLNPAFAGAAMAFSSVLVVSNSLRLKLKKL
ncbi:cadmium-translocating P-type ATPase [Candidatus Peregrinibacteria bacterium]|nr:cadmium-translocating P-type ATPase [Candidatus Peregrinibacteria bacterium]